MFNMFHFCRSSYRRSDFYLISSNSYYSIVSHVFQIKWSFGVVLDQHSCNLVGKGLFSGSSFSLPILRFVAAISNIFFMASRERTFRPFPKYLILGPSNVLRGKIGSLPNIRKNGDFFECSFGNKLYAAQAKGIKTSQFN